MEYVDINPILEVESSDEEGPDYLSIDIKISLDDGGGETPETPLSALLRQESVKSRYEFSRQDSSYKPKQQVMETFPSIRGLEYEPSKPLLSSTESPKVITRRASNLMRSNISDSVREFEKDLLLKVDDELKTLTSENIEKTISRTTTRRSKTFNAGENIEILKNILNGKYASAEAMLTAAIGNIYEADIIGRKKDSQLIEIAFTHLDHVQNRIEIFKDSQTDLIEDHQRLQQYMNGLQENAIKIDEEMIKSKTSYTENRIALENRLKSIHQKIYHAMNTQEKIIQTLKEDSERLNNRKDKKLEEEERWNMGIQDLECQLYLILTQKKNEKKKCKLLQNLVRDIEEDRMKSKILKNKIKVCTKSLCEISEYIDESRGNRNSSQDFANILSELKCEINQAIESDKEFKESATIDPKSILPYYRASEANYKY